MKLISGETREEVWLEALEHLLLHAEDSIEYDLILEVKKPGLSSSRSREVRKELDVLLRDAKKYSVHTVAETIFPSAEYKSHQLKGFTEVYPEEIYPSIKRHSGNTKGTYAYRIVRGKNAKGEDCRPLESIIKRMRSQLNGTGIRCAYDLSLDNVETIPINRNDNFIRGFPCLSHLSFKLSRNKKSLHLTALYRSHDYVGKALGNLLGLARLQACIAKEVGIGIGPIVCHSTYATLNTNNGGPGTRKLRSLVNSFKEGENAS